MKKLLMVLAFAGVSVATMAQSETPVEKYSVATNSFWSNWFIQGNVGATAFWGNQEVNNNFSKSPLKGFRLGLPTFSAAIGKWFTPGLGLRTKFFVAPLKASGRTVISEDKSTNESKSWMLSEQVLFNLSNMLLGYNEDRVWDFIPYAGVGIARNMSYNRYAPTWGVGILNEFKLSNKFAINLDVNYFIGLNDWDGVDGLLPGASRYDGRSLKGLIANHDRTLNVELGITYNLGEATWNKVPDVDALKALTQGQIDALNAQLADANAENARLKNQLANSGGTDGPVAPRTITKVVAAPVSVFFNRGKAEIASQKDMQNVKDLVEVAKANNSKIVVTGYADSDTGSAELNQDLSQRRADAVADELVNLGISRSNITVVAAGGVDTLTPPENNRRAVVTIK